MLFGSCANPNWFQNSGRHPVDMHGPVEGGSHPPLGQPVLMAAMLVLPWGFIRMSDTSVMWAVVWDVLLFSLGRPVGTQNGMP